MLQAKVKSKSRNKIYETWLKPFSRALYSERGLISGFGSCQKVFWLLHYELDCVLADRRELLLIWFCLTTLDKNVVTSTVECCVMYGLQSAQ